MFPLFFSLLISFWTLTLQCEFRALVSSKVVNLERGMRRRWSRCPLNYFLVHPRVKFLGVHGLGSCFSKSFVTFNSPQPLTLSTLWRWWPMCWSQSSRLLNVLFWSAFCWLILHVYPSKNWQVSQFFLVYSQLLFRYLFSVFPDK